MKRLRIGVVYGGRSGEHEVSLASAAAVFAHLDRHRYEPIPIRIEKDGRWVLADRPPTAISAADVIEQAQMEAGRVREGRDLVLPPRPGTDTLQLIDRGSTPANGDEPVTIVTGLGLDVIFPVLHGPYGEDGTIQGLLELANVPYVGCGVLASAAGMDKVVMKGLFRDRGLRVPEWITVKRHEWATSRDTILSGLTGALHLPVFVKPANLGSSVGISKVQAAADLGAAIDLACEFDRKVVVEMAVPDAREIECAVLGLYTPRASVPGEIIPSREFYDYQAKYLDDASRTEIPAQLEPALAAAVQAQALAAFDAIDGAGLARVDFLLSRSTGDLFVNEINTMPGFTSISMYAKLWAASGVPYAAVLDELIALAVTRHTEKQQFRTSAF